jgi:hypothetical protein
MERQYGFRKRLYWKVVVKTGRPLWILDIVMMIENTFNNIQPTVPAVASIHLTLRLSLACSQSRALFAPRIAQGPAPCASTKPPVVIAFVRENCPKVSSIVFFTKRKRRTPHESSSICRIRLLSAPNFLPHPFGGQ